MLKAGIMEMHDFHWAAILWLKQNVSDAMLKEK